MGGGGNFFENLARGFRDTFMKPAATIIGGAAGGPLGAAAGAFFGSVLSGGNRQDHLRSAALGGIGGYAGYWLGGKAGLGHIGANVLGGLGGTYLNLIAESEIRKARRQLEQAQIEQYNAYVQMEQAALEANKRAYAKVQRIARDLELESVQKTGAVEYNRRFITQRHDQFRPAPRLLAYLTKESRKAHG